VWKLRDNSPGLADTVLMSPPWPVPKRAFDALTRSVRNLPDILSDCPTRNCSSADFAGTVALPRGWERASPPTSGWTKRLNPRRSRSLYLGSMSHP